ncbi:hypothetical protein [Desulfococcus sp.]|uniref:hypothetical protein n=1 Tax=Desulfococcus sp. TaxID=2025834 RepID=UPI0035935CC0
MKPFRWHLLPMIVVAVGVMGIWGAAYAAADALGRLQWLVYLGGLTALIGAFLFKRELSDEEIRIRDQRREITAQREGLKEEQTRLEDARKAMGADLSRRTQLIAQRESDLFQKLMTFHEWMEFPAGLGAEEGQAPPACFEKDQAVMALIRSRTEQLFEDIKNKVYQKDGRFEKGRLMMDMMALMESVARIYQPDSENPLLETNVELLLRAANRIALQMLVVLEQLPLDIKSYSIRNIHDNVQTGIKIYGVYKAANPYWTFLRPVYYLGRYGLGANPVTLGVAWALGEIAKTGAKKLSSHLANRYALNLLHDMVFIVGSEAAGIFGGDFRHRESNWVFGAELTDLMRRFPLSEEMLLHGLNEIGHLRLRSEYDRIFFYRCLAARKSADPGRVDARKFLNEAERTAVGKRLAVFFNRHIPHESSRKTRQWKADAEARLGIDIAIPGR